MKRRSAYPIPLLGICDLAKHRLRPVVTATTKCEGGRKEFEIIMVCCRCGYARDARQLQQASEQLAMEVLDEIAKYEPDGAADTAAQDEETDKSAEDDSHRAPSAGARSRKKVN